MITLGIELSSRQGSVALLKDGALLAEKTWVGERVRHNTIFQTLETLLREVDVSYCDISLYAVGRGPGSFSGMRMSFAIAQALALPNKTEVRAVSSGAALALAAAREGAENICVIGDARREQFWVGFFQCSNLSDSESAFGISQKKRPAGEWQKNGLKVSEPWKLIAYDELIIPEGMLIVSPEAERLTQYFPNILSRRSPSAKADGTCDANGVNARFPLASDVAALAEKQRELEPLEPLYMHPPVFIAPKYV
jgi:tRNA threonylcarbamoyl adenosine modification protein YeaZ